MAAIGRPELANDPAYATNGDRCARREELDAVIAAWTGTLPARTARGRCWRPPMSRARACTTSPTAPPTRISWPAVACRTIDDPLIGRTLHPGPAIRLDGDPPETVVAWPGPPAGAHTDYVLHTLLGLPRQQN